MSSLPFTAGDAVAVCWLVVALVVQARCRVRPVTLDALRAREAEQRTFFW